MPIKQINPYLVDILRTNNLFPKRNNLYRDITERNNFFNKTFNLISKLSSISMAIKTGIAADSGLNYQRYITPNNPTILKLAREITNFSDPDDKKIYDIEQWVRKNITYVSDVKNYGQLERWAYPIETLRKRSGDCEDQAFLVHSLSIAAGIQPNRLRTYGGLVFNPNGSAPGGHAWTAFKRNDNRWITVDTTYYAINTLIAERIPLSEDLRYFDDFWYIQGGKTIATPYTNKVRYATKGILLDTLI